MITIFILVLKIKCCVHKNKHFKIRLRSSQVHSIINYEKLNAV